MLISVHGDESHDQLIIHDLDSTGTQTQRTYHTLFMAK